MFHVCPTEQDVLRIHHALVAMFAESDPIFPAGPRDENLLGSACSRPLTSLGGVDKYGSIELKAGALFHSLVKNHPFHNGNKRTALVATVVLLDMNHRRIRPDVSDDDVFDLVTSVARNAFPPNCHDLDADGVVEALADWFRDRITAVNRRPRSMKTTDFLRKCELAGARYRQTDGGAWLLMGPNGESRRISRSTRKLDGPAVRSYSQGLGLLNPDGGVYIDELQEGVGGEQTALRRFRTVLSRLACA